MSAKPDSHDSRTIIEKINDEDDLLEAMLSVPTHINVRMVESRRSRLFSVLWEETSLGKQVVLTNVQDREDEFIEMYGSDEEINLPTWLLRMEAQDTLLQKMCEEMGVY